MLTRTAGVAGILAGAGLAVEAALWTASGWTPRTWDDPAGAMEFLRDNGTVVRAAVFAGALNLVFTVLFLAGLADRLRTPAVVQFGIIGVATHGLVPVGLFLGIPMFVSMAGGDVAEGAWAGFAVFLGAAGGVGSLFLGLSTLAAGWAGIANNALPAWLFWVAVLAGAASLLTVLAADTALDALAGAAYVPSLTLAIIFRTAAGIHLVRTPAPATIS